jgi:hypothetical protein
VTHGTLEGYRTHRKLATTPCDPCRRAYERLYGPDEPRADGRPIAPWTPEQTVAFDRAQRIGEGQVRRWTGPNPPRARGECGTNAGYTAHRRMREAACRACKAAHAEYIREYKTRKKEPAP